MPSTPSRNPSLAGNVASPEVSLQAAAEWTTEDFQAAEPYPLPEVTEEMLNEYIEQTTPSSARGGSTLAGGPPSPVDGGKDGDDKDTEQITGYPYPPPFNQHEVLAPYTTYPYCTIGKLFFTQSGRSW